MKFVLVSYFVAYQRRGGSTLEDLPRSTLRDLGGELTFVSAAGNFLRVAGEERVFSGSMFTSIERTVDGGVTPHL